MMITVKKAKYLKGYKVHIEFSDSTKAIVDLKEELDGEVFRLLKKTAYFKQFKVKKKLGTISWPNGADFAPEFLYSLGKKQNKERFKKFSDSARKVSK